MKNKWISIFLFSITLVPVILLTLLSLSEYSEHWTRRVAIWINQYVGFESTLTNQFAYLELLIKTYLTLLSPLWAIFLVYLIHKDEKTKIPHLSQFRRGDAFLLSIFFTLCLIMGASLSLWHLNPDWIHLPIKNRYLYQLLSEYPFGIILIELFYFLILIFTLVCILGVLLTGLVKFRHKLSGLF